jgi:two-component system response regulator HydG
VAEFRASRRDQYSRDYVFLSNPRMKDIYQQVEMVAATDEVTVLIRGETGTGKEHVARLVHQYSPRASGPFIELHCAALPETLLESELFGYEAGAFTDARKSKPGLFEQAQGGTLFLDEIGELPISMQTKLLKVLEDRKLRRLGGLKTIDLNLRLVAATNRDLPQEVKDGIFRADLFYRLNVFTLELPPLRERPDDVVVLGRFFAERFAGSLGRRLNPLTGSLLKRLQNYPWPGNIRELKNAMERLVIRAAGPQLKEVDLPPEVFEERSSGGPLGQETKAMRLLLEKHRWNKSRAAVEYGVSRPTFLKILKRLGLQ